jgi:hypothetical protein
VRGQPKHIYGAACCLLPQPASWWNVDLCDNI